MTTLIKVPEEQFETSILDEIYDNLGQYTQFHEGSNRQIIQDAEKFFNTPRLMYGSDIMDVIVCAVPMPLRPILQNIGGKASSSTPTVPNLQQTGQSIEV